MMLYREYKHFTTSLIADESAKNLIVLIESDETPNEYTTDEEPGPANIFDNLHRKYNDSMDIGGINLAVVSFSDSYIRETQSVELFEKIEKHIASLSGLMEIDSKNVGVIVCSTPLSKKLYKDPYDHINVLARNRSINKHLSFPVLNPVKSKHAWTNSVPTWMYTGTGSVKEDGAGVNLLGFVVRAGAVVMFRQTEISIYDQMAAYHEGKFGKLKIVTTMSEFHEMMEDITTKRFVSIDTETPNLARVNNTLLAIQFVTANKRTDIPKMWVIAIHHAETPWTREELKVIRKAFKRWLEREATKQVHVYQNAKFDMHQWMSFLKIRWYSARIYDVMAGSFSLEENQKFMRPLQIKAYALEHMEMCAEYTRPSSLVIAKADRGRMAEFSLKDIAEYGVIDVLTPLFLMFEQVEAAKDRGYPDFLKFVTRQIGAMLYTMTEMEHNGVAVDIEYLREIASPIGPLSERIREAANQLITSEAGREANKRLVDESSFQKKGLFGEAKPPQLWNIRTKDHLIMLFFDILGLQPMGHTKDGEGKLDRLFQKTYRHTPEVKMYENYQKLGKLKSSFATAIYKYMTNHIDMKFDHRLRPSFTYTDVLTGRSCFVAGTPVAVAVKNKTVYKPIETVVEGDLVWTVNEETKQLELKPVEDRILFEERRNIVEVAYRDIDRMRYLMCTVDHPFMLKDGTWKEAQQLQPGDKLRSYYPISTSIVYVKNLYIKRRVYDLQVADNHNFFANGVCVHNSTRTPSTQQIPTHGKDAKIITRQFKVKRGRIRGKSDFSGHEVRVSGNISEDPAICDAVDIVNKVQMNYRLAVTPKELEVAVRMLQEDGDLHVQNYATFFSTKISKKDPRRQDAKAAVFAVTYGSKAKAIGQKMHAEALYAVEDELLKPDLDKAKIKKLKKQLSYLRSEKAVQDYFERADALLKVLSLKWGVLTDHIEEQQGIASHDNVVFGPHGRPRHLWGYLHFDKFVKFAMDRRVFNSQGQGYASDYGYVSIYLAKKTIWNFEKRGFKIDIKQDNAVHDSSFCDLDFRFIPLYAYIQEHAMISLTQEYYKKHWGITPKTQYGFDIEFGVDEAGMMGWDARPDGLAKIIEEMAPKSGVSEKVKNEVLKDNEILGRLRMEELRSKNPWKMTIFQDHIFDRVSHRLQCLK